MQGICHTNNWQDAHGSLLKILDILDNHTIIYPFLGLALKYYKYLNIITLLYFVIYAIVTNQTQTKPKCAYSTTFNHKHLCK